MSCVEAVHYQPLDKGDLNFSYSRWGRGKDKENKSQRCFNAFPTRKCYMMLHMSPKWIRLDRTFLVFTTVIIQNRNLQQFGLSSSEYSKYCLHIWALQLLYKVAEFRQSLFPVIKLCSRPKVIGFLSQLVIFCKNLLSYSNITEWCWYFYPHG